MNNRVWNGQRIISEQWIRESTKERLRFGRSQQWGYGYHWMQAEMQIGDRVAHSHFVPSDGNQILAVFPGIEMVVVFTAGDRKTTWITEYLIKRGDEIHLIDKYMPVPRLSLDPIARKYDEVGDDSILRGFVWMDVVELRRHYGHRIGFCGNLDVTTWANGTQEEIKRMVLHKLNAAKGGGYIVQSDHSVPINVSGEGYDYVIQLLREYGQYPLRLGEYDIPDLQ